MTPLARRIYAPSVTSGALGTALALVGVICDSFDLWRLGLVALVASIPALCYCLAHRAAQASDDQLAETHSAGYRLALRHVSLGLLDSPAAPPDGGEGVGEEDTQGICTIRSGDLPNNVRPFRPRDSKGNDRKVV
ncbi:hypothetical protein ACFWAA_33605 [Streptomyces sp. NPDC059922]|uniref:hypothetical protein n=1 Tax=Streptomyces sp. NPDC059922 TaxID=3347005 RepID=UPI003664E0AC